MRRVTQRVAFATLVLMVAIAGAAVASGKITGASIKDNSVTGKDIKNHSLTAVDFKGSIGAAPMSFTTEQRSGAVDAGAAMGGIVACPSGSKVVSGGYESTAGVVFINRPSDDGKGWVVAMFNPTDQSATLTGYATCSGPGRTAATMSRQTGWRATAGRFTRR